MPDNDNNRVSQTIAPRCLVSFALGVNTPIFGISIRDVSQTRTWLRGETTTADASRAAVSVNVAGHFERNPPLSVEISFAAHNPPFRVGAR